MINFLAIISYCSYLPDDGEDVEREEFWLSVVEQEEINAERVVTQVAELVGYAGQSDARLPRETVTPREDPVMQGILFRKYEGQLKTKK